MSRPIFVVGLLFLMIMTGVCTPRVGAPRETASRFSALVFSKTAAFRHASIPAAIDAIRELALRHHFVVDATEDAAVFTDENLGRYQVVIFALTTGDVLDEAQQAAFERYIRSGGGYVGIHSASDTEYDWAWYGGLVGAYFRGHGPVEQGTIKVADRAHSATAVLPRQWVRTDEWYHFRTDPRSTVHVVAALAGTASLPDSAAMGRGHPIAWCQEYDGGRSFYTAGGHTAESYAEPLFLDHLLKGIETAAGVTPADCTASQTSSFDKVRVAGDTHAPMDLAVASDGRVIFVEREGAVRVVEPDGSVLDAGRMEVYTGQEFGLLSVALDPDFATNGWIYLYYSPAAARAVDRVSRFTLEANRLERDSEVVVLEVDVQREQCCHAGAAIRFDTEGNLVIATGDNTNPFESDGYTPIDERAGRAAWDAQRTSANSKSLNGKLLRIRPQPDGSYIIPRGNLFPAGTPKTRPEIYAMGFRNPFTIGIDPATNRILVADYGPDAANVDSLRGPDGRVEWNIVDRPGFYGWPYCVGDNTPYHSYDFATGEAGWAFDCAGGVRNNSPNNTGITAVPPALPAALWMGTTTTGVPEIGPGRAPMTSGAYWFDAALASDRKWPAYWDGTAILGDWNDGRLFAVQLATTGQKPTSAEDSETASVAGVLRIFEEEPFFHRPHRLEFGPDGALYVIDWGTSWSGRDDSAIYRVDYAPGKRPQLAHEVAGQMPNSSSAAPRAETAQPLIADRNVSEPRPADCSDRRRDDFDGEELDRSQWTTVVRETGDLRIEGGHLVIPTANADMIFAGGSAPNVVLQELPAGPFVATVKLTLEARQGYQQAGLIVYGDDDNYAKIVLSGRSDAADASTRIFEFLREEGGQPNDQFVSDALGTNYPDTVWVRFTSDGRNLRASYSADGESFAEMQETRMLEGVANPKLGLIAMAGPVSAPVIDARFDWFEICPAPGAAP